jgi:hypothetical protein
MHTTNWTERLSEYLDGSLTPAEMVACEAWLSQSAEGRSLLEELRGVVAKAKTLPDVPVPASVWAGISKEIGQRTLGRAGEVVPIDSRPTERPSSVIRSRRWPAGPLPMAAAATVLLALGMGIGFKLRPQGAVVGQPIGQQGVVVTPVSNSITRKADESYDRAVADLQVILQQLI